MDKEGTKKKSGTLCGEAERMAMEAVLERVGKEERHALSTVSKAWHEADAQSRASVRIFNCYGALPSRLSGRFGNLKRIKVKGRPRADDYSLVAPNWGGFATPWIKEIVRAYHQLESLHLKRMVVTDADLSLLAMENLQELTLELCQQFSTAGLRFLANCRSLRVLSLRASIVESRGAEWLQELALKNKVLEVLDIDCLDASCVDVRDLEILAPSLKVLKVPFFVPLRTLEGVLQRATGLTGLGAGAFAEFDHVDDQRVRLPDTLVSLSGLLNVADMHVPKLQLVAANLKELDLKAVPALSEVGYIQLMSLCGNLEQLQVGHHVGDNVLSAIGKYCKKLRKLHVERVIEDEDANITHHGVLAVVEGCAHLTYLLVYAADMTNAALSAIGRNCRNMRDFRFVLVEGCKVYTEKTLDDGLRDLLRGWPNLTRLCFYVRKGFITDSGLEHIGTYGVNLKALLLGCAGTTGMGMRYLGPGDLERGCRNLEKIEIRDCPVSGQCLADLIVGMFPNNLGDPKSFRLRYLWLQNADFTGEEILSIEGRVKPNKPNVHVEFVMPSAPGDSGHVEHHHPFQLFAYCAVDGARTDRPVTTVELG